MLSRPLLLSPRKRTRYQTLDDVFDSASCLKCGIVPLPRGISVGDHGLPMCPGCSDSATWLNYLRFAKKNASSTQTQTATKLRTVGKVLTSRGYSPSDIFPLHGTPSFEMINAFLTYKLEVNVSAKYLRSCVFQWDQFNQSRGANSAYAEERIVRLLD